MVDARNIGALVMDVPAGTNLTALIFDEIRKRKPEWKANTLHTLELVSLEDFSFSMDGWTFDSTRGYMYMNSVIFKDMIMLTDAKQLHMLFRYDD